MTKKLLLAIAIINSIACYSQTINSFSPTSGKVESVLTINGTAFSNIPSNNSVKINGLPMEVLTSTTTTMNVKVPTNAITGPISIDTNEGQSISSSIFTVTNTQTCNTLSKNNAKHWYFGNRAAIKFENNIPEALTNSAMTQAEGVATISDKNGDLLFYTNGITIYNKNHEIMNNGNGLTSHSSNTQAAFIVPFATDQNKYYVITPDPYYYSVVDMTLDNGNGAVVPNQKNILITEERSEKVAGVMSSNDVDLWLITFGTLQKRFNVYKIDENGISNTPVKSEFTTPAGHYGYMKISPDGTKIATANFTNTFHLYDFNKTTGVVSNQKIISFPGGGHGSYGIDFSPNGQLVYVADHRGHNRIYQYDITKSTPEEIAASNVPLFQNNVALGALQLGSDNKLYVALENSNYLGVINQPNIIGTDCNYQSQGVFLKEKTSNLGLPSFVSSSIVFNSPYIQSFVPKKGSAGQTVTISGTDFSINTANNFVKINNTDAEVTSATSNTLTIKIPANASSGRISVNIGCSTVTTTDILEIENLHVNSEESNKILIYPNPTTSQINFSTTVSKLELYSLDGKLILTNYNVKTLDISKLHTGMYLLKGVTEKGKIIESKLIKKD